jgi:H+-transporting ATPase
VQKGIKLLSLHYGTTWPCVQYSDRFLAPIGDVKDKPLHTFSFLILLYFAVFSVVSARERRWFWATLPSKSLIAALTADALVGTVLAFVGLPGLAPLPWQQMLAIFGYAMVSCLVVNDAVKVTMMKRLVPTAVA